MTALPEPLRTLILGLSGGDFSRCIREPDGQVSVWNSRHARELEWQRRHREAELASKRRWWRDNRGGGRALRAVPDLQPEPASANIDTIAPSITLAPPPPLPVHGPWPAPQLVSTRGVLDAEDEWWDPATGTLAIPVAEAVAARQQLLATREAAHSEALAELQRKAARKAATAAARTPSARRKAERKAARAAEAPGEQLDQLAALLADDQRAHARLGVPLFTVEQRHQVVVDRDVLRVIGTLQRTGEHARLRKVIGALDLLRTEGPEHPSLRSKRLAGDLGTGPDGRAVYQSNVESGTSSAWRLRWCWGTGAEGQGVIDVLHLGPHGSGGAGGAS